MTVGGFDARVLVLGSAPSGHMDGLMGVLGGAGYRVDVRDHSDATGRLPIEAMDYDIVVLSPRALAPQPAPAADLGDVGGDDGHGDGEDRAGEGAALIHVLQDEGAAAGLMEAAAAGI